MAISHLLRLDCQPQLVRKKGNNMKLHVIALAVILTAVFGTSAHADNFYFSFTANSTADGNIPGTVTGELIGLNNNDTTATPTDIIIDTAPAGDEVGPLPLDINAFVALAGSDGEKATAGSFNVQNDMIVGADILVDATGGIDGSDEVFIFLNAAVGSGSPTGPTIVYETALASSAENTALFNSNEATGFAATTYALAPDTNAVPEPSTYALLLVGAAALFAGRRFLSAKHSV
jgi:hypothetical protein